MIAKLMPAIRILGLADSEVEFHNKLLNPAFRFGLILWSFLSVIVVGTMVVSLLPSLNLSQLMPKREGSSASRADLPIRPDRNAASAIPAPFVPVQAAAHAASVTTPVRPAVTAVELPPEGIAEPASASASTEPDEEEMPIVASAARKLYHSRECRLRPAPRRKPAYFSTAEAAAKEGYRPCPRCQNGEKPDDPVGADEKNEKPETSPSSARQSGTEGESESDVGAHTDKPERDSDKQEGGPVLATTARRIFHSEECPLRPAPHRNPVTFTGAGAAKSAGFQPCSRCQVDS